MANIDKLSMMITVQALAQDARGFDFEKMSIEDKATYIKRQTLHCIDELCEMLHEIPFYKEWKRYDEVNISGMLPKAKEELIDAIHFIINIALGLGMSVDDIYIQFMRKNNENMRRLADTINYKLDCEENK